MKRYFSGLMVVAALSALPAYSDAGQHAKNGFAFCEKSLKEMPLVKEDSRIAGRNALGFLHFTSAGQVEVQGDRSVKYTSSDDAGNLSALGITIPARHCSRISQAVHACKPLAEARTEDLYFTYLNGKVKDVTIQHFENGAWTADKLTFLVSDNGQSCYVQHVHSDVTLPENESMDATATEFDLETCKLARSLSYNKFARDALIKSGGMTKFSQCKSRFAKKAVDLFFKDYPESSATFNAPTALVAPAASAATVGTADSPSDSDSN